MSALRLVFVLAFGLALASCSEGPPQGASAEQCSVTKVIDGDTVDLTCADRGEVRARLVGFDTPAVFSPQCLTEKMRGDEATAHLRREVLLSSRTDVRFEGTDRYDRALVKLWLDGEDVTKTMVENGYARRYSGGRRKSWCT